MTDTGELERLLPCPFCGSETTLSHDRFSDDEFVICCGSCDTIGPTGKDKAGAVSEWNTRAALEGKG